MWIYQRDVLKFRVVMGLHVGDVTSPGFASAAEARLCASLINEEVGETVRAIRARDIEGLVDGLCDALYVTCGAAISIGFNMSAMVQTLSPTTSIRRPCAFERPEHMAEILLGAARAACLAIDDRDAYSSAPALAGLACAVGYVANEWGIPLRPFWREVQRANMDKVGGPVRADGKRLKPPGWQGPDHWPMLVELGLAAREGGSS